MEKNEGPIFGNIAILLFYTALLAFRDGGFIIYGIVIMIHVMILGIAGISMNMDQPKENKRGTPYLISMGIILLIGFSVCGLMIQ